MPDVNAIFDLAVNEHRAGRLDQAEQLYQSVLSQQPTHAKAWNFLAIVRYARGDAAAAIDFLQRAIQIEPRIGEFYSNLGNIFWETSRFADAELALRQVLALLPDHLPALRTLGHVLCVLNRCDEALPLYKRASAIDPRDASLQRALGFAYGVVGLAQEAIAVYQRAAAMTGDPVFSVLEATQLPVVYDSPTNVQQWRDRLNERIDNLLANQVQLDIATQPALPLFQLPHQGYCDRQLMQKLTRLFRPPAESLLPLVSRKDDRIHVGFISTEFGDRTVGRLIAGLIKRLNRKEFHVTLFSVGRDANGVGLELAESVNQFVVIPHNLPRARQLISDHAVHCLVYPDIGMDPTTSTLAFSRLASVQCTTWGHPETTGLPTIDYFLSSAEMEIPDADSHYSERLVRLPSLTFGYEQPPAPTIQLTREQLGLSPNANLYICPQSIFKFHPDFDAAVAGVLRADSKAQFALIRWKYAHSDEILRRRFDRVMPDVADRIVFVRRLSSTEFLSFLALADVMLDPFPYGGGYTSLEAFSLSVPIVTLPTQFLRGRITQAFCRRLGLESCIARDVQDYVQIALRLATDAGFRQQVRDQIAARQSTLFDDDSAVRDWEQFFREATHRAPPQFIAAAQ